MYLYRITLEDETTHEVVGLDARQARQEFEQTNPRLPRVRTIEYLSPAYESQFACGV